MNYETIHKYSLNIIMYNIPIIITYLFWIFIHEFSSRYINFKKPSNIIYKLNDYKIIYLFKTYFIWIFLHYLASYLYVKLCNHYSIFGFIISPIISNSVHCVAIRWVIIEGSNIILLMWIEFGKYVSSHIVKKNTN